MSCFEWLLQQKQKTIFDRNVTKKKTLAKHYFKRNNNKKTLN